MHLSWEPLSDASVAIAVAREESSLASNSSSAVSSGKYRIAYLTPPEDDAPPVLAHEYVADAGTRGAAVSSDGRPRPEQAFRSSHFGAAKLVLPKGWVFEPLPPPPPEKPGEEQKREVGVVSGPSGSGKSYFLRSYLRNYLKMFPKNTAYLISSLGEDKTLDAVRELKRIDLDKLVANPPKDVNTWKNSLVIIDDVEDLEPAKAEAVQRVQDMISAKGRHGSCTLLRASHLSTDYKRTRLLLGEAHSFTIFPQSGSASQYHYLLTKYAGLDSKAATHLLRNTPGRWICVHHTAPRYIMTPTTLYVMGPQL